MFSSDKFVKRNAEEVGKFYAKINIRQRFTAFPAVYVLVRSTYSFRKFVL